VILNKKIKIIIKTPKFIGDTIMMLSAFELLKSEYPDAEFTIVTLSSCVDIFRNKDISKIIIDTTKDSNNRLLSTISLIKEIREHEYDYGFIFHNTFLDALIFKLSRIKFLIGYRKENNKLLLNYSLKIDRNRHYINHYAYLVNSFLEKKYTKLKEINLFYNKYNFEKQGCNIAFVLGGDNKGSRQYPVNLSLELFQLMANTQYNIILLGDSNDTKSNEIYEKYLVNHQINVENLSGKTNVAKFIDIVGSCDLLVTIDSSAMHIASSTNTPFIALIGKGTSVFETVKPKVDFGIYLRDDNLDIDDIDLIKNIKPKFIKHNIDKIVGIK
jgi:heptosyltransferase-2